MSSFIPTIVESPYAGNISRNVQYARQLMKWCLNKKYAPFCSHLLYTQVLDDNIPEDREKGINAGFAWHAGAKQVVFGVDYGFSGGMRQGLNWANENKIPIKYIRLFSVPNQFYILINGKRYAGKDTVADILTKELGGVKDGLSYICKEMFCKENNLDFDRMLNDQAYKESYRSQLVKYANTQITSNSPSYFVDNLLKKYDNQNQLVIIPDIRLEADISPYFTRENSIKVKVTTSDEVKKKRGWVYNKEIDEAPMECALDNYSVWDVILKNNKDIDNLINEVKNQLIIPYQLKQKIKEE